MGMKTIALNPRQTKEQTRAFAQECPLGEYDMATRRQELAQLAARINDSQDDKEQRRLKALLPFRCPHYTRFRDNYRDRGHIVAESFTWQTCIDIDDPQLVEKADAMSDKLDSEEGIWKGMMLHKDYSIRRKLHIDLRLPVGMTVPEAQRCYCKALGVEADTTCFTPERFIYISPADFEIYRSEGWYEQLSEEEVAMRRKAYTDRGLSIDGRTKEGSYYDGGETGTKNVAEAPQAAETHQGAEQRHFRTEFKGIPYTDIIREYWQRTGGEPVEGERNKRLHQLAANLRAICDNSEEWLLQVMPTFGLSDSEMQSIVHSACKESTRGSRLMDSIVREEVQRRKEDGWDDTQSSAPAPAQPCNLANPLPRTFAPQPRRLPIGLRETLVGVPEEMQMPVLCSVLPLAAAYADGVEVEYCDGQRQHLGLMSIVHGEQASGKSVCKAAVDVWKRQLDEEDRLARRREEVWKERRKGRKANEKAPEDPHVLIRMIPVTVSCSTLLRRFKNAAGHTLYSFGEELDTLRKTNGAGSWSSKYDIYRLSFDRGEWGQDYNSDQAESGVVSVAYNWTMLGTDGALRRCFRQDNIENGLSSRVLVCGMPDSSFQRMPKFGRRTAEDEARIQEAATRLRSFSGFIDTPRLRKAIGQWVEQKRVEAAKDIDRVKDVFRKRAAVIGFRCGVVHHLLSIKNERTKARNEAPDGHETEAIGQPVQNPAPDASVQRESKATLDFALMMAEYCLTEQINAFGEAMENGFIDARSECQRYGANHSVFDQLPPTFTMDDLRALKRNFCGESALRNIITRWRHDGWIEKVDARHWRKCHFATLPH